MKKAWNRIEIPKERLQELYEKERLSISQIAAKLDCSPPTVHRNLKEYGIKIRSISEAKEIFKISKKELNNLYHKQKLSTFQIGQKYGCSHSTIVNRMKKFGIKSRGHIGLTKPIRVSKENLKYLYYEKSLSLAKIAKILHCSEGGVERRFNSYGLTSRGIDNRACKYKKKDFNDDLIEKAYMIGFRLGDLNVYSPKNIICIRCSTTKRAQVKLIRNLFKKYGGIYVTRAKRGTLEIICYLNRSFKFLLPKEDKIPNWILKNNLCFLSFLAGYIDAEGCFYLNKSKRCRYPLALFEIQAQDKTIILQSWKKLLQLDISSLSPSVSKKAGTVDKGGTRNNKDMWRFGICKKTSLWRFIHLLKPFMKHEGKIKAAQKVKENIIARNKQARCHPIDLSIPIVA